MIDEILLEAEEKMEKTITNYRNELVKIRTGRANPAMLDGVMVNYYGAPTPLNTLAGISVSEGRQLVIKPYDRNSFKDIERGIFEANLGLTPQNDGNVIRINIPPLTEERRRDMVKDVKKLAESQKVAIRNVRRKAIDDVEKLLDNEDAVKDGKNQVQKLTDQYIKEVDKITKDKEADLMTV